MSYKIVQANEEDKELLAEIRLLAMKESLEFLDRFDPKRARHRFLETFSRKHTWKITIGENVVGFYVLRLHESHFHLDHLYFRPNFQGEGLGGRVLAGIKQQAKVAELPIRLGALRESRSNDFYKKNGFSYTHEEEWDIYYEFAHAEKMKSDLP
ncbi:MAG: GNAT superfamily N-acetyltransferase [Oceanicoccus sp.]|jgi:GNAT superfamily N-acetyltransferase